MPEYDARLCAFDPSARARFVSPEHYEVLWAQANGALRPPVLLNGRLSGHWRLAGRGTRRALHLTMFRGSRIDRGDSTLAGAVAALDAALDVRIGTVAFG